MELRVIANALLPSMISAVLFSSHVVNGFQHNLPARCRDGRTHGCSCRDVSTANLQLRGRLLSSSPESRVIAIDVQQTHATIRNSALLKAIADFPQTIQLKQTERCSPLTVDAQRIFHGRGGLYEGANHLTLDFYPPVFLLTSFEELREVELDAYGDALADMWKSLVHDNDEDAIPFTWVYQSRAEKGASTTTLMSGEIPEPHIVTESNGKNKFIVHLLKHSNHGLFLDMSAGRQWVQEICANGGSVLNLFAYTCAFSIAALNGGADLVVNVDMSRGALKTGQRNHELNGIGSGSAKFLPHDLFKTWGKIKNLGPYDVVVVDPPSYQKGSFVASKDYMKVIRRLPSLLRPNGYALLCLNAPELSPEFLLEQVSEGVPNYELCFVERLENPPAFASACSERALKVLVFQYRPCDNSEQEIEHQ